MSNKRVQTEFRVGVGASSILMVLVVLALTAVSLLSFQSALNAEALTNRNLQMTTAYYEASARVQRKLAGLDTVLAVVKAKSIADTESLATLLLPLGLAELNVWEADGGQLAFSFAEDAENDRKIEVQGFLALTGSEEVRYTIARYQLVSAPMEEEWDVDLMMPDLFYMEAAERPFE